MPRIQLTDVGLRALRPPERGTKDYWDITLPSFGCRISNGGAKTFILKLSNSRRSIGRFPIISLAKAREEAKRLLAERTLGKVRPQSITVEVAKGLFLAEKKKGRRTSTVADLEDRLERHFSIKGQLADVTHQEIVRRLNKIKTPQEHNAALRVGKSFFTWAQNRRYIGDNPFRGISPHSTQSRSRVLTDEELAKIWKCTTEPWVTKLPKSYCTIVKLLILTGQRRNEIASLQSSWIDEKEKTMTLPASVTKNGREHTITLGQLSASILKEIGTKSGFSFPARGNPNSSFSGWSKSKAQLDRKIVDIGGKISTNWTLHDLRRTYATKMADLGVAPHVIERLLNHVSGQISGVSAIYNRAKYLDEMREAIDKYEAWLEYPC